MLGLSFLLLIGFMLIAEGAHLAHLTVAAHNVNNPIAGVFRYHLMLHLGRLTDKNGNWPVNS